MDTLGSTITPLLDALARGAAAGASAAAQSASGDAAATLARLARANQAALVADGRVVPALAAAICSRHADGAVVARATMAAADLFQHCPAAARRQQQDSFVRLGALQAAVRRLSAGGYCGGAAACLVGYLADGREDVAAAAVAAGALPRLVALMRDADASVAHNAAGALSCVGRAGSPGAAAAVDAGAVRAAAGLLARTGVSAAAFRDVLQLLGKVVQTPAGAARLVRDGALPHVVRLLRSPARRVADAAVYCLAAATHSRTWDAVAEALLADDAAAPGLAAVLLGPVSDAPFRAACVLFKTMARALARGGPEASAKVAGIAAAVRRAGAVPRLVELRRTDLEGERRRSFAMSVTGALAFMCLWDAAAAREALGAGAWPEACRVVVEDDALAQRSDADPLTLSLSLLAALAPHLRDGGAPRAAAAAQPGLAAALSRAMGRAAAGVPPGTRASSAPHGPRRCGGPGGGAGGRRRAPVRRRVRPRGRRRPPGARHARVGGRSGSWRGGPHGPCEGVGARTLSSHCGMRGPHQPGFAKLCSTAQASLFPQPLAPAQPHGPAHTSHARPRSARTLPAARGAAGGGRRRRGVVPCGGGGEGPGAARVRPLGADRGGRGGRAAGRCCSRAAGGRFGGGPRRGAQGAAAHARARAGAARSRLHAAAVRRLRRARVARPAAHAVRRLPGPRALVQRRVPAERLGKRSQNRVPGEEGGRD
jgi:hypothetical protein